MLWLLLVPLWTIRSRKIEYICRLPWTRWEGLRVTGPYHSDNALDEGKGGRLAEV